MRLSTTIQWLVGATLAVALTAVILTMLLGRHAAPVGGFLGEVNIAALERSAVWHQGRLKSFESFAHEVVGEIAGRSGVREPAGEPGAEAVKLPQTIAYLDLMLRPDRWANADIIYVKKKPMRARLGGDLLAEGAVDEAWAEAFIETGLVSEPLLQSMPAARVMSDWSRDLLRTAKFVGAIDNARALRRPQTLGWLLSVVPAPSGEAKAPWVSVDDLWPSPRTRPEIAAAVDGLDAGKREALRGWWGEVARAWRAEDAQGVEDALAQFLSAARSVAPDLYPSTSRLSWESLYFKAAHFVWAWVVYLLAVFFLLMSTAFRWDWARRVGLGAFLVAFGIQTGALVLRWYVSGRWPNSNMFEAVTTSVWFGVVVALVLEFLGRRLPLRNLFAIGAGAASMAAMMSAQFIEELDPNINNMMPILHDIWLYIHTNVIIASYALIAMAAATAILYLLRRLVRNDGAYARVGGAGLLIETASGSEDQRSISMGEVLDGATLVLMELAFILLWAGLVMGAIWADHSWGRPWGWDPKEVFALNTFLVFAVLIHVRIKVRDKGLWTAILAVIGCGVMLFNWIVINFWISGLHSYA